MSHDHDHPVGPASDRGWLLAALGLLLGFMVVEVVIGFLAGSLALLSDAGHMLTDVASLVLVLVAMKLSARPAKGALTFGLRRAEILSAQLNGATLLVLGGWFVYEGVGRLLRPVHVVGELVVLVAVVGVAVNVAAAACIGKADRRSLNIQGAFQHVLTDLYAFIATVVAGLVVWLAGFRPADAIAALIVAALMLRSGWVLTRRSARVLLEAAPEGVSPDVIGAQLVTLPGVAEVHDLHIWEIASGAAALSAHILVEDGDDCHGQRGAIERLLADQYGLRHTTLQVDHVADGDGHCADAHGAVHRSAARQEVSARAPQTGRHELHR